MENVDMAVEEKFYQDIADLLHIQNPYTPNVHKSWRTRWNNRKPGNGRFEGLGLIRFFSPSMIHVCLKEPVRVNKIFTSSEDVLNYLKQNI